MQIPSLIEIFLLRITKIGNSKQLPDVIGPQRDLGRSIIKFSKAFGPNGLINKEGLSLSHGTLDKVQRKWFSFVLGLYRLVNQNKNYW